MCAVSRIRRSGLVVILAVCFVRPVIAADEVFQAETYHVGVAAIDITPERPIRLNGFGFRREEATEVRQRIWAKALVIGTDEQRPAVLVTVDVLGIPDKLVGELAERLAEQTSIERERLAVTATHTHSGPMLQGENETLFGTPIPEEHLVHIAEYTRVFKLKLEQVVLDALADRQPAKLTWGIGTVRFAKNRRSADGPVDHDLPVLAVHSLSGELRAVYTSYACHCVTLSDNLISGDWAGYAQAAIERDFPDAIALCSVGCGADLNPNSGVTGDRADIALAQGEELATEVRRLLGGFMAPVRGELTTEFTRVVLPLAPLPTRAEWERRAAAENAVGHYARVQLARLDRGEALIEEIHAPIQTWRFGDSLAVVLLPGETVVDYSLRLKRELDASRLWINGYSNAAPGYIPSERVLAEGGYEGGSAMTYYDIPGPYAPGLEQKIIDAVRAQAGEEFAATVDVSRTNNVPPLSPQQAAARIQTRPELRAQLVLAEPLVIDPVAIDFAPDGSLWVAEMHDYPEGPGGDYQPGGQVRLVRDTDGDGRYDTATLFLDDIPFPTGVTTWRDGVLVCAAPDILFARDTDGDGRADETRVLYSGFGTGNYQARVNSLVYGLDGWVYGSCGLFGGKITSFAGGDPLALGDRDFRIKPDSGLIQPATGRTQQGRVRDDWGRWFGCNNSALLIHYPLADHDLRRNPFLRAPVSQIGIAPSNQLYPAIPPLTFKLSGPPGLTTAACGVGIYRDDLLGPNFTGNSFTCEPVSQVVHRLQLSPSGATLTAQRAVDEQDREFLASTDGWFRPVHARTGPDGALWVVDMCRYIIEHPRWIPPESAAQVDLRAGQSMGRIYRVVPRSGTPRRIECLNELDTNGLVQALDTPNGPQRDLAGQLLVWRDDESVIPALKAMAEDSTRPEARLHAMVLLEEFDAVTNGLLVAMLQDEHPGVRRQAVRIAAARLPGSPEIVAGLLNLEDDADGAVRVQLAIALGESEDPRAAAALVRLALHHPGDPFLSTAVKSSISPSNVEAMLDAALSPREGIPPSDLIEQLLVVAASIDKTEALGQAVEVVTAADEGMFQPWQTIGLASLLSTLSERDVPLADILGEQNAQRVHARLADLRRAAADAELAEPRRLSALSVLGRDYGEQAADLKLLEELLSPQESIAVQTAAIAALGRINRMDSLSVLVDGWSTATPQVRGAIFDAIVSRPAWLPKLLDRFSRGQFAAVELDAARVQRLVEHADENVRRRASGIFGQFAPGDRQAVVERYASAAELQGDAVHGRTLFVKTCAVCHKLDSLGHQVGPDLGPLVNKTAEYLLLSILDPSRAMDSRYLNYTVLLQDGRTLSGMLAEESGESITLAMQEGKRQSILRRDIDLLRSTGKSLMPDGLEKDLSEQDMADLLAFLKQKSRSSTEPSKPFAGNEPRLVEPEDDGRLLLLATNGAIYGDSIIYEAPFQNIGYWHGEQDHVTWQVRTTAPASFDVWMVYACDNASAGNRYLLEGVEQPLRGEIPGTGGWDRYERVLIGSVKLAPGDHEFTFRPDGPLSRPALVDLHGLEFVPSGDAPRLEIAAAAAPQPDESADPREIATQLLNDALSTDERQTLIAEHATIAAELIGALSENLPPGQEEYRRIPWIWRVAIAAGQRNQGSEIVSILKVSLPAADQPLRDWQAVVIGGGIVNGISQQNAWPAERIAELTDDDELLAAKWSRVIESSAAMADDEKVPTGTRYDALRILGCGDWQPHGEHLLRYLDEGTNAELQMGAVSGLTDVDSKQATAALAAALTHLTGRNRSLAISGLLRGNARAAALLDAIEKGTVSADELSEEQVLALSMHKDAEIRRRSRRVLPE